VRWEKIKNTEGSAMSVGLLVARLKYGLYVGHLSKWFVFVFNVQFLVVCLWLHCRLLGLLITFCVQAIVALCCACGRAMALARCYR